MNWSHYLPCGSHLPSLGTLLPWKRLMNWSCLPRMELLMIRSVWSASAPKARNTLPITTNFGSALAGFHSTPSVRHLMRLLSLPEPCRYDFHSAGISSLASHNSNQRRLAKTFATDTLFSSTPWLGRHYLCATLCGQIQPFYLGLWHAN